jgi:hypothetical protein
MSDHLYSITYMAQRVWPQRPSMTGTEHRTEVVTADDLVALVAYARRQGESHRLTTWALPAGTTVHIDIARHVPDRILAGDWTIPWSVTHGSERTIWHSDRADLANLHGLDDERQARGEQTTPTMAKLLGRGNGDPTCCPWCAQQGCSPDCSGSPDLGEICSDCGSPMFGGPDMMHSCDHEPALQRWILWRSGALPASEAS